MIRLQELAPRFCPEHWALCANDVDADADAFGDTAPISPQRLTTEKRREFAALCGEYVVRALALESLSDELDDLEWHWLHDGRFLPRTFRLAAMDNALATLLMHEPDRLVLLRDSPTLAHLPCVKEAYARQVVQPTEHVATFRDERGAHAPPTEAP